MHKNSLVYNEINGIKIYYKKNRISGFLFYNKVYNFIRNINFFENIFASKTCF